MHLDFFVRMMPAIGGLHDGWDFMQRLRHVDNYRNRLLTAAPTLWETLREGVEHRQPPNDVNDWFIA